MLPTTQEEYVREFEKLLRRIGKHNISYLTGLFSAVDIEDFIHAAAEALSERIEWDLESMEASDIIGCLGRIDLPKKAPVHKIRERLEVDGVTGCTPEEVLVRRENEREKARRSRLYLKKVIRMYAGRRGWNLRRLTEYQASRLRRMYIILHEYIFNIVLTSARMTAKEFLLHLEHHKGLKISRPTLYATLAIGILEDRDEKNREV